MTDLMYRGVKYSADTQPSPSPQADPLALQVQHSDPNPNFARTGHLPAPQPVHRLTYRGAAYEQPPLRPIQKGQILLEEMRAKRAVPVPVTSQRGRTFPQGHSGEMNKRHSVLAYLQARQSAAKILGDRNRVILLQQEIQLLA
jgi:hypothetical protein